MRLKKEREDNAGYRRSTVALSPVALAIAERLQDRLGLGSREAVINAVFERIAGYYGYGPEVIASSLECLAVYEPAAVSESS